MAITQSAVRQVITWYKGDTFNPTMRFWSDEDHTTPIDLTGRTYIFTVRDRESDDLLLTASTSDGITVDGNELLFDFIMDVAVGTYNYDLQETNGTTVTTILGGLVTIKQEVTQ